MATQRHAPRARRLTAHRTPADSIFLAHGANVNVRDESGWRPLHYAALCRSQRVLRLLLASRSVDVDAPNDLGWRPLDMCATVEDARALLDAGIVIGTQISIIVWGRMEDSLAGHNVTTVEQPHPDKAGTRMIDMLMDLQNGTPALALQELWEPVLLPGETVGRYHAT